MSICFCERYYTLSDYFLDNYKKYDYVHDIVKIPMYFTFSDKYLRTHTDEIAQLRLHSKQYFTNDMIYDTLLGIMNIKCQHYNPENDLCSPSYKHDLKDLKTIEGKVELEKCL